MNTKELITDLLREMKRGSATGLAQRIGISRQAVSRHLRDLMADGRVIKEGVTRGAVFRPAKRGERRPRQGRYSKQLLLSGLEEDVVFREMSLVLNLKRILSQAALSIVDYAFTEILNNAIEHSKTDECRVTVETVGPALDFVIRDTGIGVFHSIREKFGLRDEDAAVAELLKGKATTMRARHSGEGIFFTSKAADRFMLRSHRVNLIFETKNRNVIVRRERFLEGTQARFTLSCRSRRDLAALFDQYAPEEFDHRFDRTRVFVKMFQAECVSRSAARRLVTRLPDFREVILDFSDVRSLGQAYADEIFRVFAHANPGITFRLENLEPALKPMVEHVMDARVFERVVFG